jgi:hypothetical protein
MPCSGVFPEHPSLRRWLIFSQRAICQELGLPLQALLKYPRVRMLLQQLVRERPRYNALRSRSRESDLAGRVEKAILDLQRHRQPVTQKAISRRVGLTPAGLRNYPRVKALLATVSRKRAAKSNQNG